MELKIQVDCIQFQRHHTISVDGETIGAILVTTRITHGVEKTLNSAHLYGESGSTMLDLPDSATFDECLQAIKLSLAEAA